MKIGQYINDNFKGITPQYVEQSSTIVLNQKCIRNSIIDFGQAQYISDKQNIADKKYISKGDILICSTGQGTAGRCAYVSSIPENCKVTIDSHILVCRCNNDIISAVIAYIVFSLESLVMSFLTGSSGQAELDKLRLFNIDITIPKNKHLKNVISFLQALDAKIQLNKQINHELEIMAKELYDYWFVQFDFPDKNGKQYKTSGGEMVYNEQLKREIPKGWKIENLYNIAAFDNGIICQKYRPKGQEKTLPVIKIKEMHNGITDDTEVVVTNIPLKSKISDGDILFSWSATLEVMYWFGGSGALNQHIFKVVPKPYFTKEYVFYQLAAYVTMFIKIAESRKTTMGHITLDHLKQSLVLLPPKEYISAFSKIISPMRTKIGKTKIENRELVKLREELLPLLMNGQATISDINNNGLNSRPVLKPKISV